MKRVLLTAVFFILLGFVSNISAQQVLYGNFNFDYTMQGFTLDKNTGERVYTAYVKFEPGFDKMPTVIMSVNKLDSSKDDNIRYDVSADAVSRDGFTIKIKTWGNSKIYGIGGGWIAFGGK
ncbi:MAG: hypothetical protein F9K45_10820 [Melioribacteraceae bacterium]|nr:MAG: hypothetical protein F9K45_10820 [Melioribacteraceae bacterium]